MSGSAASKSGPAAFKSGPAGAMAPAGAFAHPVYTARGWACIVPESDERRVLVVYAFSWGRDGGLGRHRSIEKPRKTIVFSTFSKMAQDGPKTAQDGPKMAQRRPKGAQREVKMT